MKISLIGTGAFSSALAKVLIENGHRVSLYGIDEGEINDLKKGRNSKYFQNMTFPQAPYQVTNKIEEVLVDPDFIILATPSSANVSVLKQIQEKSHKAFKFVNIAKGFYPQSCNLLSEILMHQFPQVIASYAALLGPSFATEIFQQSFTMLNILGHDKDFNELVRKAFVNKYFKIFSHEHFRHGQYYANLKNIYALAGGMMSTLYDSYNSLVSVITLAFQEIDFYLKKHYQKNDTYAQLAAFGDFVLTCSSTKSRNFTFGQNIAKYGLKHCKEKYGNITVEGYRSLLSFYTKVKPEIENYPLLKSLYEICYQNKDPQKLLDFLEV